MGWRRCSPRLTPPTPSPTRSRPRAPPARVDPLPGLSLREAYVFAIAPCDPDDAPLAAAFLRFAAAFARQRRVHPGLALPPPRLPARSEAELAVLESCYRVLDL